MKNFVLALLMLAAMLCAVSSANATPRGVVVRDRFGRAVIVDRGFHGGSVRGVRGFDRPPVVEIDRGFFGRVRSVRVR
jgi:hypothetical protein